MSELIEFLKRVAPPEIGFTNDLHGMVLGSRVGWTQKGIRRVGVSVDASMDVILQAAKQKIPLLIVHNNFLQGNAGFLGTGEQKITKIAFSSNVMIYAIRSSWIAAEGGICEQVVQKLNLRIEKTFEIRESGGKSVPIGRVCSQMGDKILTLNDLGNRIRRLLASSIVRVVGNREREIKHACICFGCEITPDLIEHAYDLGCDCMVTCDVPFECGTFARNLDIAILEASKYAILEEGMHSLSNILALEFPRDEVTFLSSEDPFSVTTAL